MARLVKHEQEGPYRIEIGGEKKSICGCGLSKNLPYCDGTHKITRDEESGKVYQYDENNNRQEVG